MVDTQRLQELRGKVLGHFRAREEQETTESLREFFSAANAQVNGGAWQFLRSNYQHEDADTVAEILDQAISARESDPNGEVLHFNMGNPG